MRFIYKLLIGLIVFNAMLFIFAGYFPTSPPDYKYDVIDPTDPNVDTNL